MPLPRCRFYREKRQRPTRPIEGTHPAVPAPTARTYLPRILDLIERSLPFADVQPGPAGDDGTIEGARGAYRVKVLDHHDGQVQSLSVHVSLAQSPGAPSPLPVEDQPMLPNGSYTIVSDYGGSLRVDPHALASAVAQIVTDFEATSPALSAQATY